MQLNYTLTLDDYRAALRLHARQNLGRRFATFFLRRALPGIGFLLLAMEAFLVFADKNYLIHNPPGLLIVPVVFVVLGALQSYQVQRQFNQLFPPHGRGLSIDLDDERIICTNPGSSESRFLWHVVIEFAQNEKVTMLYIAKLRFLFFPTSALSPIQRTELDGLVARHLNKKKP
jgi:hypothetical protein